MKSAVKRPFLISVAVLALMCLPALADFKEKVKDAGDEDRVAVLINKVAAAYGGMGAIERVRAVYAKGGIEAFLRGDRGTYVRYFERDRKLRVDIVYSRSAEYRLLDGSKGYRGTGSTPLAPVTGPRYEAMVYQYKELDLPWGLVSERYRVTYEGTGSVGGREVEVLGLSDAEGSAIKVFIDSEKGLILRTAGSFNIQGASTTLAAEFSNFRPVDGTVMPFEVTNFAGGMRIGRTLMEEYRINPEFPESLWEPTRK